MLILAWLGIIGFCVMMYVILDGFTLGIGMLLPFLKTEQRNIALSVILPTWDGNQTWLVLGMASLYGAFPIAFSFLLPQLYMPLLIMVVALLLRGVAFEFRLKSHRGQRHWDMIFASSALAAALVQGYILGEFVQGFEHANLIAGIDPFDCFTAFSLVVGYVLLGATRLILKTEHALQAQMFIIAKIFACLLIFLIGIVSLWTPFVYPLVMARWFNLQLMPFLAILPFITCASFLALIILLMKSNDTWPYWLAVVLFICPYIGFAISIFPYIVPYKMTLWQAASSASTLKFILVGAIIMLPVLLAYTFYSYRIFRGKVNETLHY